jgi:hypothetical protein
MPNVTVMGLDGHRLEVNGVRRGLLSPSGKLVPVDEGWVTFAAFAADDTPYRDLDREIFPVDNDAIDLT